MENLGDISFDPELHPHQEDKEDEIHEDVRNGCNPAMHMKAGREVITERPPLYRVKTRGKEEAKRIVNGYKGLVFIQRVH